MKIQSVEAIPITASFKSTFRFGTTDRTTSPNVVVLIRTDDGAVGYGEACPVPAFTSETQHSIVELVEQRVAPLFPAAIPSTASHSCTIWAVSSRRRRSRWRPSTRRCWT